MLDGIGSDSGDGSRRRTVEYSGYASQGGPDSATLRARRMNGAFPDVVVTEEDLIASGDKVVERSSAIATHKGAMMGTPPTDKRIKWSEIHIYRLQDGKIAEHWAAVSMMELMQQIGALPQLG